MTYLLFFIFTFIIIFLIYNIFVIKKENALKKMKKSKDVAVLSKLGNINIETVDFEKLARLLSICNSFIVSFIGTIVLILSKYISNFYIWIISSTIIGMVLFIPIIIICYKFIGNIIKKEGK